VSSRNLGLGSNLAWENWRKLAHLEEAKVVTRSRV
jgi:hypothetical protein